MSAWLGHGPLTDERNKHGLTLKIKKFRQPFESQSSLPLVAACSLYLFSFTARIDIRNCLCLVPVHQERVIFMNRHNKGLHSLGLAPNCAIQICFHFQFVIAAANFFVCLFWLVGNVVVVTSTSDSRFVFHRCRLCRLCGSTSNIVSTHKQQ
jgi:hypothetical protein